MGNSSEDIKSLWEEFESRMESHDWWYRMSDKHGVYRKGKENYKIFCGMAVRLSKVDFNRVKEIWNANSPDEQKFPEGFLFKGAKVVSENKNVEIKKVAEKLGIPVKDFQDDSYYDYKNDKFELEEHFSANRREGVMKKEASMLSESLGYKSGMQVMDLSSNRIKKAGFSIVQESGLKNKYGQSAILDVLAWPEKVIKVDVSVMNEADNGSDKMCRLVNSVIAENIGHAVIHGDRIADLKDLFDYTNFVKDETLYKEAREFSGDFLIPEAEFSQMFGEKIMSKIKDNSFEKEARVNPGMYVAKIADEFAKKFSSVQLGTILGRIAGAVQSEKENIANRSMRMASTIFTKIADKFIEIDAEYNARERDPGFEKIKSNYSNMLDNMISDKGINNEVFANELAGWVGKENVKVGIER